MNKGLLALAVVVIGAVIYLSGVEKRARPNPALPLPLLKSSAPSD